MTAYVTKDAFKDTLSLTNESFADDDIDLALESASAAIDSVCGRTFGLGEEDEERVFIPERPGVLIIDDMVAVTSVASNGSSSAEFQPWEPTDYVKYPHNAPAKNEPWTELRLEPNSGISFTLVDPLVQGYTSANSYTTVKVTGQYGWLEVPAPVQQATGLLAARFLKRSREAPFGVTGMGMDGMAVRISARDPDVWMLLATYSRPVRLS